MQKSIIKVRHLFSVDLTGFWITMEDQITFPTSVDTLGQMASFPVVTFHNSMIASFQNQHIFTEIERQELKAEI